MKVCFTLHSTIMLFVYLVGRRNTRFKNCVLVFEPSCRNHIIVLTKLVKFLRSLRVPVLFGESDIQNEVIGLSFNEFCTKFNITTF